MKKFYFYDIIYYLKKDCNTKRGNRMNWSYCKISDFSSEEYDKAYENLSLSRKKRIDRLTAPYSRKRSLAGELLVLKTLKKEYNIDGVIECDEKGRPYLKENKIFISIAHSGEYVACAVDESPIGIDIEKIRDIDFKISNRICTEDEKEYLFENEREKLYRFYEIWTAKEAFFKMQGTGIKNFKSVNILELNRKVFNLGEYLVQIVKKDCN